MIKITANGTYILDSDSAGTYHELVASVIGSASCKALVRMKRQPNSAWEQVTSQPVDTTIVAAGILLGTVAALELTVTEFTGVGYIEVELISREVGNPDNVSRSRANIQSIARVYPAGVSLVTVGRQRLNYQSVQNRDMQAIYFWHGLVPTDITQTTYLPIDPSTWTAEQKTAAATLIQTYGEKVDAGATYEPHMAQTGPLYSCVATGSAIAHVKVG